MTDPEEQALYERMVNDAMGAFGYSRPNAEKLIKGVIPRIRHQVQIQPVRQKKVTRKKKVNRIRNQNEPMTREEIAKLPPLVPPRPAPRNAKERMERMERALEPDEGERRRRGGGLPPNAGVGIDGDAFGKCAANFGMAPEAFDAIGIRRRAFR